MKKRFEYEFVALECYEKPAQHTARLNKFGAEGWELIGTLPGYFGNDECTVGFLIFKRELI
jgi:Domain of unknown function (DUF4177)